MASSTASGSLKPSAPKSLMPLSCQGLCEAEMTTPAWKPCVRARNATAGVVTMPALSTCAPASRRPCCQRSRDPRPGLARVAAQKHPGFQPTACLAQRVRQRQSHAINRRRVERCLARDGANAVSSEKFACGRCGHDVDFLPRLPEVGDRARFSGPCGARRPRRFNAARKRAIGQARSQAVACGNLRRRAHEGAISRKHQGVTAIEHCQGRQGMQARV